MAIRIRDIDGKKVALCAAKSEPKDGDIYLDDSVHHALTTKFGLDFFSMGFIDDPMADELLIYKMAKEMDGRLW